MGGIGKHKYSTNHNSIWNPDSAICPYCGDEECDADWVSVGVGLVQCGPYECLNCGAIEIGSADGAVELSENEVETGWYLPEREYIGSGNTVGGKLVKHDEAIAAYRAGALDEKKLTRGYEDDLF